MILDSKAASSSQKHAVCQLSIVQLFKLPWWAWPEVYCGPLLSEDMFVEQHPHLHAVHLAFHMPNTSLL
jgi:hypothetical protein